MPAVNNVLVVGSGLAGAATAIQLAAGRRRRRPVEIKPDVAALGSGITLQGNALRELQRARRLGRRCRPPATPSTSPASARPTRPARVRRRDPRRQDRRPGPARRHGHAPPRAGPHPRSTGPPRSASSCGSARRSPSSTQDDDGVDVTFSDGSTGRYDLVVGADGVRSWTRRALGIDLETEVDRHGHLARLRARARPASPAPTSTTAARPTSPATAPPARTRSTPTSSRTRRTASTLSPDEQLATMKRALAGLPRPVGRDPREPDRPVAGSTTPGSRPTCCRRRGTAAGSCSSATPRTPARPPSPRAAPWPWRTPSSSPSC